MMRSITNRYVNTPVNYNCPTCMLLNKLPNIAGRFHIINDTECKCNGCNTIYSKEMFYNFSYSNRSIWGQK